MAKATLNGVPLLAFGAVGWSLTAGVNPYTRIFEVLKSDLPQILGPGAGDVELVFEPLGGWGFVDPLAGTSKVTIKKLRITSIHSGSTPKTRGVRLADRRWLWRRQLVARSYNVRRRTGEITNISGTDRRPKLKEDITYQYWSMNEGKPWTALEVLEDVLTALTGGNDDWSISANARRQLEVEGLEIHDQGTYAMLRVLRHLPGLKCFVDYDGKIRIVDGLDLSERGVLLEAGPRIIGAGVPATMDNRYTRPKKINVLFTRVCDLRFDFDEGVAPATTGPRPGREPRRLENIISVPDLSFTAVGRTVSRGTHMEFNEWLDALEVIADQPATMPPLSQAILRRHACTSFSRLKMFYGHDINMNQDVVWTQRINALRKDWRIKYRIIREWKDRIRSVRAYQAQVIDVETGARAPSEAHMDYIQRPTYRTLAKNRQQNTDSIFQVRGYADLLKNGKVAPASVRVVDEDNGVLTVKLYTDAWGESDFLLPGFTSDTAVQSAGDLRTLFQRITLDSGFKMALVLSCIQASPNNEGRFHKVTVNPNDARKILKQDIGQCWGPEWTILIGAGVETARFQWKDEDAERIENAFRGEGEFPEELLHNETYIKEIAHAAAARIYARLLDRAEGSMATGLNGDILPLGTIANVSHQISANGTAFTFLAAPPELRGPDLQSLLPSTTRRAINRMVVP